MDVDMQVTGENSVIPTLEQARVGGARDACSGLWSLHSNGASGTAVPLVRHTNS